MTGAASEKLSLEMAAYIHDLALQLATQAAANEFEALAYILGIAAAEAAVGLGIIIAIFRNRESLDVDDANILKL